MGFQKLTKTVACSTGADLWIVPDVAHSPWARKIDWYLNLRMCHARVHSRLERPQPLQSILDNNEIQFEDIAVSTQAPLMVASRKRLPNVQTVELPYSGDGKKWLQQAHQIWVQLSRPSLRLFLPEDIGDDQLPKMWPEADSDSDIGYVSGNMANEV